MLSLITKSASFAKYSRNNQAMAPILGNGLFLSEGEFWKRQRRLMQPAFHAKRIGAYAQIMVDYAAEFAVEWQTGATRAVDVDMSNLTMRIIAKTLFDADIESEAAEIAQVHREL